MTEFERDNRTRINRVLKQTFPSVQVKDTESCLIAAKTQKDKFAISLPGNEVNILGKKLVFFDLPPTKS